VVAMLVAMLSLIIAVDGQLQLPQQENITVMSRQESAVIESNIDQLYQALLRNKRDTDEFLVALLYAEDVFSSRVAPLFDATPQFFPFPNNIKFVAFNAKNNRKMILRFRLQGFPTIVCFHKGKIKSRLEAKYTMENIIRFVNRSTGISPIKGQAPRMWASDQDVARLDLQDPFLHLSVLVIVLGGLHLLYQSSRRAVEPPDHEKSD